MYLSVGLILTLLFGAAVMFTQHDYIADINYISLDFYDRSIFKSVKITNLKLNRTYKAITICANILVDLENEDLYKANIKAFKIISNVPMKAPIFQTDVKLIELTKRNLFGFTDFITKGNVTGFPFKKGNYCINKFHIDSTQLPPLIPGGEYKSILSVLYDKMLLATISGYGKVIYKMNRGHK